MINRAITARMATPQPINPPLEQPQDGNQNTRWYAADLGFFDPNYDDKPKSTGEAMEHTGNNIIFRDVYWFIERAKDIVAIWRRELVRQNLSTCLKEAALAWYTSELVADQKRLITLGHGIDEWEHMLVRRFGKKPSNMATPTVVLWDRHTVSDAYDSRKPDEYTNIIIRSASVLAFEPID